MIDVLQMVVTVALLVIAFEKGRRYGRRER